MERSNLKVMPVQTPQMPTAKPKMSTLHKRRVIILVTVLVAILAIGGWQLYTMHTQIARSTQTVHSAKQSLKKVQQQKHALNVQVDQLHNDDYLEKLVRQKYMVSKSGEVIFQLPGTAGKLLTPATAK